MLINLAFIKAVNGLFYFALDYIAELEDVTSAILVRSPQLAAAIRRRHPAAPLRVVNGRQAAAAIWAASWHGEITFTPSSHPIPGCRKQLIVVHDTFPFEGRSGAVKAALFFLVMRTSRAWGGYINRADAKAFLLNGGIPAKRLIATPNHMALPDDARIQGALVVPNRPVIGLFGTDSPKKNYDALLAKLAVSASSTRFDIRLYGQSNRYVASLIDRFPGLNITVSDSGVQDLETFARSVDILASAATREGFSRPIAAALSLGVPCWIVDAPVFREFYGSAATFHTDIADLADALLALVPGATLTRPDFTLPATLDSDFRRSLAWLRAEDIQHR